MKLSSLKKPFVCMVVSERLQRDAVETIQAHERNVDAFEVNLTVLDQKDFKDVFSSTAKPCTATNRRADFMKFYGYRNLQEVKEDERARRLIAAVDAGASAIDCELDMFDEASLAAKPKYLSREERYYASNPSSKPAELSKNRLAVSKQEGFVRQVKQTGAEVVYSCHTQTVIRKSQAMTIMSEMEDRGADFGKIVSLTLHESDLTSFVESVIALKDTSKIPFNLMNVGVESILGRLLSSKLGSAWIYCRPDSGRGYGGQPTVGQARAFFTMTGVGTGIGESAI